MPFIFTSNVTQSGTHANMGSALSETAFVANAATLVGTASNAIILGSGTHQNAIVNGELFATGATAIALSGQDATVEIGGDASVRSGAASHAVAVSVTGAGSSLLNAGTIGGARGVWLGGTGSTLFNTGTITGIGEPDTALQAAIQIGHGLGATGVATMRIVNHGLIMGETWAIDDGQIFVLDSIAYDYGVTALTIENHGALQGGVRTEDGDDVIYNTGLIAGDIWLGGDDDTYEGGPAGIVIGVVRGGAGADWLRGGAGDDLFWGEAGADVLLGRNGDDTLLGGDGGDTLGGGAGDDWLEGGGNGDLIRGGDGQDTILAGTDFGWDEVYGGNGHDSIETGEGKDQIYGGQGDDTIFAGGDDDFVHGGAGDDYIDMGNGTDRAYGLAGNDTIIAGAGGSDDLRGGDGDDVIDASGGYGWDEIRGGRGNDTMTGGGGKDTFIFYREAGHDVITDFTNGQDLLDLTAFGTGFAALSVAGAFSGDAGATVIDLSVAGGVGTIALLGFDIGLLNGGDFLF